MIRRARSAFCLALICAAACQSPPEAQHQTLGGNVVARAGDEAISATLVAGVARAQGRSPSDALRLLLSDALLSQGARAKHLDRSPAVARDLVALRARLVADRLRSDAKAAGPCSDAEVDHLSQIHLKDVELPERVQVIHAIAIRPKNAAPNQDQEIQHAKEIADAIRAATQGATSADDFEARAKTVAHVGVEVRVEALPAFGDDGVVPETGGGMDATFAHAAFVLKSPGDISPVVESPFGWHVIRLNARLPAKDVPREERRAMFAEECATNRARTAFDAVIAARHKAAKIEIAQDANEAMTQVTSRLVAP